jgi:hypothetical protein
MKGETFMDVVNHARDGCQWNPDEDRGALPSDQHFRTREAEVEVGGAGSGIRYRLCASCAALLPFASRIQQPIRKAAACRA